MLNLFYGGTFDPVHNGHMAIARAARDELDAVVRLMPAADPPHRAPPGATAEQRAVMLDLAVADEPGLVVDRRELQRAQAQPGSRSYTIDTLHELRGELGERAPMALLIGADSLVGLPTWREWRQLFDYTHFIVAERAGSPLDSGMPEELARFIEVRWVSLPEKLTEAPAGSLFRLKHPLQMESASQIRRRIAMGQAWQDLVPGVVADYIADNRLYFT
ncbi:nicotinate-nucleotide adenylyltransferase [Pseudoxanthomonas sp. UTMC 1351]|uniref:nicotinate-nucleotide adenylyltransferase n=1 Tax=Pseudoxanthomonas sp. UTMC 1351 TaxID=2695853 RepID=UPI0034D00937